MFNLPSDKELREFSKWGVEPPAHTDHGLKPEQLEKELIPTEAYSWHLEGNELVAETNHGTLRQTIPTDYICLGMDDKGLPILKRIGESHTK